MFCFATVVLCPVLFSRSDFFIEGWVPLTTFSLFSSPEPWGREYILVPRTIFVSHAKAPPAKRNEMGSEDEDVSKYSRRFRKETSRACFSCARSCYPFSLPFRRLPRRLFRIAHFQKEWKPGTRIGARSVAGSFGDTRLKTNARASTPNNPIIKRSPNVAPGFHSFWKWAMRVISARALVGIKKMAPFFFYKRVWGPIIFFSLVLNQAVNFF